MNKSLKNGEFWYDKDGNIIHAHGGHMLKQDDFYYWYGEDRRDNIYVSCYRSKDLMNWEFCNHVLTVDSALAVTRVSRDLSNIALLNSEGGKVNLERPKVLYNELTKKYVMWIHYENGMNYLDACCAVATCDTPDGDFVFHGSFRPYGHMSRDCTLFQDDNGKAYFISASRDNLDMNIYLLQDDYLNVSKLVNSIFPNENREAPAVVKKDNRYYMISSLCSGWAPNQGGYSFASSFDGEWSVNKKLGDRLTYRTQPAFIITVQTKNGTEYLYIGDRWGGNTWDWGDPELPVSGKGFDYFNSLYYFSRLKINGDEVVLEPCDSFEIELSSFD